MYIFFQVSPELYGDNYPRFFTYWTVSIIIIFGYNPLLLNSLFLFTSYKYTIFKFDRRMHIKQLDVTIYYVRDLFKQTIG
jgi:hypothetical protein